MYLPQEREALLTALADSDAAVANALDLGDMGSPFGCIHPRNKQTVSLAGRAVSRRGAATTLVHIEAFSPGLAGVDGVF